jgi:alpha-tubulin suppressor-like RCC1 family protein
MKGRHFWAWTSVLTLVLLWPALAAAKAKTPVVAAGQDHSLTIRADGTLWVCGRNNYGKLGLGDTTDKHAPT